MKVSISNYRNIPSDTSIKFELKDGVTFILGVNNIGKSNLLKFFYDFKSAWYSIIQKLKSPHYGSDIHFDFHSRQTFDHLINQNSTKGNEIRCELSYENIQVEINFSCQGTDRHTSNCFGSLKFKHINPKLLYTDPAELFNIINNILYVGSFRSGLNNSNGLNYDIHVGTNFIQQWNGWSAGNEISKRREIASLIDELKELFGYKKLDIKVSQDGNNLLITNDDGMFQLNELGDGIAHFVIVLANVMIKQPTFVLIDEPEIGLHPKMQEIFVRTLASKAKFGILATSHSVGLARSIADNIYSLTKSSEGKLNILPFGEHFKPTISQSISEMGYSQYVELGGTNILLVEGRTDIKTFREILRKFNIEQHYIIMSFGGSQFIIKDKPKIIDELNELKRFNTNVFVIFDSERTEKDALLLRRFEVFKETCEELGFIVFPTDYHSSDNYINQAAVDKIIGNDVKALEPFEKPERWTASMKEKNWLMIREMNKADFDNTELKKFIEQSMAAKIKKN